jgi:HK97 family phage prohead protease
MISNIATNQIREPLYDYWDRGPACPTVQVGARFSYRPESQPTLSSVPPAEPAINRDIRAAATEFIALRRAFDCNAVARAVAHVLPALYLGEKRNTEILVKTLCEQPDTFNYERLKNITRVTKAKIASLPVSLERRSMEFQSQTRASGDRRVKFIVSRSDVIDRHGTRIITSGIDLSNYKRNPVFLWNHAAWGFTTPDIENVIAKAVGFRQDDTILELEVEFFSAATNPRSEQALRMVREGGLSATSIGFIPKEIVIEMVNEKEVPTITKSELLECSLVMVPSNPGVSVSN